MKAKIWVNLLIFAVFLISSMAIASAQDEPAFVYTLSIKSSTDYCNCDDDCRDSEADMDGCLTGDSSTFLKSLNSLWSTYVADAHDAGYNGVCAELYFAGHQTPNQMTKNCSLQFEIQEDPEEEEPVEEEPVEEPQEDPAVEVVESISGASIVKDDQGTNESQDPKNNEGGDTMEVTSAQLIALTVIVIGFFGLMGWIAYLLQK